MNSLLTCTRYALIDSMKSEESIVFQVFTGTKIKLELSQWYEANVTSGSRHITLRYNDDNGNLLGSCSFLPRYYDFDEEVRTLSLRIMIDSFQISHEYRLWIQN